LPKSSRLFTASRRISLALSTSLALVIPAQAGIHPASLASFVIPAQAVIHVAA